MKIEAKDIDSTLIRRQLVVAPELSFQNIVFEYFGDEFKKLIDDGKIDVVVSECGYKSYLPEGTIERILSQT